ncbi:MAG: hypothetical protein ABS81_03185 [Pseudonocardia sp. SCN 72-86]|nr:MAG: hypothetical protein ABS81_03185 [Pseudonocardia sp. SCN 72-86]
MVRDVLNNKRIADRPVVDVIDEKLVDALALGCAVYGAGGGGNVETGSWAAKHALEQHGPTALVGLAELDDDDLILPLHAIGAPTVSQEMLPSGEEPGLIRDEIERVFGRPVAALMAGEIGGANGVRSAGWAAALGVPLLDADGMGRAFPEIDMVSMELASIVPSVIVVADVQGNVVTCRPVSGPWAERLARAVCVASGSTALMTSYVMTAREARGAVIEGSVSAAVRVGELLLAGGCSVADLCVHLGATRLIVGKIVELEREDAGGWVRGSVVVSGAGEDRGRLVRLEIQNENLVALEDGRAVATVPDPIVVLDADTARALGTDTLQFGQRVAVVAWPCHPLWRTPAGLAKTGPAAFGYDIDYRPIEQLSAPI